MRQKGLTNRDKKLYHKQDIIWNHKQDINQNFLRNTYTATYPSACILAPHDIC